MKAGTDRMTRRVPVQQRVGGTGLEGGELSEGSVQKTIDRLRSCPRYYCSWG